MPPSPATMIIDLRDEFDTLIDFVTEADTAKLYEVERSLFSMLLALGVKLLALFFAVRSQALHREGPDAAKYFAGSRPFHSFKRRNYLSVFGKITYRYPYYWSRERGGCSPLEQELDLPRRQYSDLLSQMCTALSVQVPYAKCAAFFKQFFWLDLSTRVLWEQVDDQSRAVESFYDTKAPPEAEEEAAIRVVQIDGKGVPMRRDSAGELKKKEAVVTAIYSIDARSRSPEEVVASLFDKERTANKNGPGPGSRPRHKHLFARLDGKEAALSRLKDQACRRARRPDQVALCDGDKALQAGIELNFKDYTLILDLMHVMEYLWKAAAAACDWTRQRSWVRQRTLEILQGQVENVIALIEHTREQTKKAENRYELEKVLTYFRRNRDRMRYDHYLERGWPIATGVIESACGHLVKDRFEGAGMRWNPSSADALLKLRAVSTNEDWDAYHDFRRERTFKGRFGLDRKPLKLHELEVLNPDSKLYHQLV